MKKLIIPATPTSNRKERRAWAKHNGKIVKTTNKPYVRTVKKEKYQLPKFK